MNESRIVTDDDKAKVINYIKEHIKRHDHVIVGFAVEAVQNLENFHFVEGGSQKQDFIKSIAKRLEVTKHYQIDKSDDGRYLNDFSVSVNPAYKNELWYEFKKGIIVGSITLTIGILLWLIGNQSKRQDYKQLEKRVEQVEKAISDSDNVK